MLLPFVLYLWLEYYSTFTSRISLTAANSGGGNMEGSYTCARHIFFQDFHLRFHSENDHGLHKFYLLFILLMRIMSTSFQYFNRKIGIYFLIKQPQNTVALADSQWLSSNNMFTTRGINTSFVFFFKKRKYSVKNFQWPYKEQISLDTSQIQKLYLHENKVI